PSCAGICQVSSRQGRRDMCRSRRRSGSRRLVKQDDFGLHGPRAAPQATIAEQSMQPQEGRKAVVTSPDAMAESLDEDPHIAGPAAPYLTGAVWAFVCLGIAMRVLRYALNYPIWSDEAFVAANLIDRDYLALLRPLDYGQLCPVLFLWAERA